MKNKETATLGDQINDVITIAKGSLIRLGELYQFTYNSYDHIVATVRKDTREKIEIQYAIGMNPDGSRMFKSSEYEKDEIIKIYKELAYINLPLNGVYRLVTIVEILLGDLVRLILLKIPKKMGKEKTVQISSILEAASVEEILIRVIGDHLNALKYKTLMDFSDSVSEIFSFKLSDIPAYYRYIEIKATRDIYIHSQGIANEVYRKKAGSHARVDADISLPMDAQYYMQSYEYCFNLCNTLEKKLHEKFNSQKYLTRLLSPLASGSNA